jgi:hypothetical protein
MSKLTGDERIFLTAVRDGKGIWPLVKTLGYGWAVREGLVRKIGPDYTLDFQITDLGRSALGEQPEVKE